jgi:ankyrin repeat protein
MINNVTREHSTNSSMPLDSTKFVKSTNQASDVYQVCSSEYLLNNTIDPVSTGATVLGDRVVSPVDSNDILVAKLLNIIPNNNHEHFKIQSQLEKGIGVHDMTINGISLLSCSVIYNSADLCSLMLSFPQTNINAKDSNGETALHKAIRQGNIDIAKMLIELGADVNIAGINGETALHKAIRQGNIDIAKMLIVANADINAKDSSNETALYKANRQSNTDIAKMLIELGADVNIADIPNQSQDNNEMLIEEIHDQSQDNNEMLIEEVEADPNDDNETLIYVNRRSIGG